MPRTRNQRVGDLAIVSDEAFPVPVPEETYESESSEDENETTEFRFAGKTFDTYQQMVDAKRQRNEDMLRSSGLLQASSQFRDDHVSNKRKTASVRGIKSDPKRKRPGELVRRKSSRIAGVESEGLYVEEERSGRFTIRGSASKTGFLSKDDVTIVSEEQNSNDGFFNGRINDGSDLTVSEAVELTGAKWVKEHTVENANRFIRQGLPALLNQELNSRNGRVKGDTNSKNVPLTDQIDSLSLDEANAVAKVTPERIFAIECNPSPHHLLVAAGDKRGHLGLWNVDQIADSPDATSEGVAPHDSADGVHLFKPHNGAITHLEWNCSGSQLLSASYDGSVRNLDVATQTFEQIFATYDDSKEFKDQLGANLDEGYRYWIQYVTTDHRNANDSKCLFLTTSTGKVIHVDLRRKGRISYNASLSPKKINTASLHPNGTTLATAGLDTTVALWDVRKFSASASSTKQQQLEPFARQHVGKSINSAFFSPSGSTLLTTTMMNTLDLIEDAHLQSGLITTPTHRIRHNNQTGRWLSTLMARWHPGLFNNEMFVVGSMQQPRTVELYSGASGKHLRDVRGEAMTAVASRCCFHPNSNKLIVVGGNSSGRVTVAR